MRIRTLTAITLLLAAAFAPAQKIVVGKLGQALKQVSIRSKPSTSARTYYKVKPYEYLVINAFNDKYHKVLLQNGSQGYVETASVARLPYDVTMDKPKSSKGGLVASGRSIGTITSRSQAAAASTAYTGTPYKWGGNDPNAGIDCSAFVKYLYGKIGIDLPRTAAQQVSVGKAITKLEDLQAGDRLYFWSKSRGKIGHTGIYLGNGYFSHSSSTRGGVATDYLGDPKWRNILVAARR